MMRGFGVWRSAGRILPRVPRRCLGGQLLLALFFLLLFFRQIALALFERVVWFGQEYPFSFGDDFVSMLAPYRRP